MCDLFTNDTLISLSTCHISFISPTPEPASHSQRSEFSPQFILSLDITRLVIICLSRHKIEIEKSNLDVWIYYNATCYNSRGCASESKKWGCSEVSPKPQLSFTTSHRTFFLAVWPKSLIPISYSHRPVHLSQQAHL